MHGDIFPTCTLDDIADFRNGKGLSPSRYSLSGKYPVYGSNGQIARTDEMLNPYPVIVIGRVGAFCGSVYNVDEPSWVTDNAIVATPKPGVDFGFLYYRLKRLDLNRTAVGSAQPLVTQGGLKLVITEIPPPIEQHAIAAILGSLDDKIELNRQMNQTMEAMAQALFKSWFVDFEPFRDQDMQDSPLGLIPKGWRVATIGDLGDIICGKTPPTQDLGNYGGGIPFVTIPDMHNRVFVTVTGSYLSEKGAATQSKKLLPKHAVCVSCIATPGLVALTSEPSHTNQQINSIICNSRTSPYWCYLAMASLRQEIVTGGAGGSATLNLNKSEFSKLQLVKPSQEVMWQFHQIVKPLFCRILANEFENISLASIRDTLLPKLLSGEIQVKNADRFVEVKT